MKEFHVEKEEIKKLLANGLPAAIQSSFFAIANMFIQIKINGFGTTAVAAYTANNSVDNFFWCFSSAVNAAIMTVAGQNYGVRNIKRVKRVMIDGTIIELVGCILFGSFFVLFKKQIFGLYLSDPAATKISMQMISVVACSYWTYTLIESCASVLKGCGDMVGPMYLSLFGICIVRIAYLFLVEQKEAYYPLFAYPVSWTISSLLFLIYYLRSNLWNENNDEK